MAARGDSWDARAERDIGVFIVRYLAENPPPPDACFAGELERWGLNLRHGGEVRLSAQGIRPLRSA